MTGDRSLQLHWSRADQQGRRESQPLSSEIDTCALPFLS